MKNDSGSRADILAAIRRRSVPSAELPPLTGPWIEFPDRHAHFATTLASVGGNCVEVATLDQLREDVSRLPVLAGAQHVYSEVPEVLPTTDTVTRVTDPHDLADLDFALVRGEFGVAENGAVWLTDARLHHRATLFITQHLALVVPRSEIVNNMHEAYQRLQFAGRGYGLFLSGPSKTADIEQSLVIGAHGARSLTVYLLGDPPT